MADEQKTRLRLEIAHVLFIDIVGYSKLSIDEQQRAIAQLNGAVKSTPAYCEAEAAKRSAKLPTGDGVALVFYQSPEEPVECAMEIARQLSAADTLKVRMGIHSGPVSGTIDLEGRANVAGEGINIAQRVMDCGDAGHILLSQRLAQDLSQFKHWRPHLHDLGECEVKHGKRIGLVNLFMSEIGNSDRPAKLECAAPVAPPIVMAPEHGAKPWRWIVIALLLVAAVIAGAILFSKRSAPQEKVVAAPPLPAASSSPEKSIAVLPFENLSSDKENAYFADGVQDEILTNLARIADLKVISRTSVMQYKDAATRKLPDIAATLKVAHVLEGSVQRAASRVRVNAQLIDARTDAHLWGQTYDRDLADVFAIQSEIAKAIADQLRAKLSSKEVADLQAKPTNDLIAYDLYLRANELNRQSVSSIGVSGIDLTRKMIPLLEAAIQRDPAFLPALCQLAHSHLFIYWQGDSKIPKQSCQTAAVATRESCSSESAVHEISLDKMRTGVDVDLVQRGVARVNESMRRVRRNDDNTASFHFPLFIADRDGDAAFDGECDLNVGMLVQRRTLPGLGLDDVGREGRAVDFADKLMRQSDKRQLLEIDEAHPSVSANDRPAAS